MSKRIKQGIICLSIAVAMLFLGYFGGVVFTSTGVGNEQMSSQNAIAALQAANTESNNALVLTAQYLENLVPAAANIAQKKIAIFVTNDTQTNTLSGVEDLLKKSNAIIHSVTLINPETLDDNRSAETASIINHTIPAGATINPTYENVGERLGVELAWLTLGPATGMEAAPAVHTKTDQPVSGASAKKKTAERSTNLAAQKSQSNFLSVRTSLISPMEIDKSASALVENHLITLLDTKLQGDADYALLLSGNKFTPGQSMILAGIASGLAERGAGVVLASPDPCLNSPVNVVRSMETYRRRISTVEDSDGILGQVSSVLALHLGRATEQYGYSSTATKAFPAG